MKRPWRAACLLVAGLMALAATLILLNKPISRPDADMRQVRASAVLGYLRDGERFHLSDAYPQAWDEAQFAPSWRALGRYETLKLSSFDERYLTSEHPLLLLWREAELVEVLEMREDLTGYPRFRTQMGDAAFTLPRERARFLCTFISDEDARGGYYLCTPEGEAV